MPAATAATAAAGRYCSCGSNCGGDSPERDVECARRSTQRASAASDIELHKSQSTLRIIQHVRSAASRMSTRKTT